MKNTIKYHDWNNSSDGRYKTKSGEYIAGVQEYESDNPKGTVSITIRHRTNGKKFTMKITPEILESMGYFRK